MDNNDLDMIKIVLIVNLIVSVWILFLFVAFAQPPDDSMMPLYVGIITFVVLVVAEILCWLFHIPAWIRKGWTCICKGVTWIHDKTEPKEDSHADS